MAKETQEGITVKKAENFSEWYTQVVQKAQLADYSPIKGCMIIRPWGYALWEKIQEFFDKNIKDLGVENAYFPLFVPEEFFHKEAQHAEGFAPEVAWIERTDEDGARLAIRPTSETVMYDAYAKWIRSHRDLPLRINQWANVVRWDTKATRLFLRTREFLWQEGHCVYATEKEVQDETKLYLDEYKRVAEELLAVPVLQGIKTEMEKFPGADYTTTIEGLMPDGKALQMGTSHNLGQGFANSFDISFLDEDGKKQRPWQNSWGISTRLIGAVIMVHGDDKGLVLPPRMAKTKGVIVPILFKGKEAPVMKAAKEVESLLDDVMLDDREQHSTGWKFSEWEMKGIPLRIEIGPKDVEKKQVVLVRRDNNEKTMLPLSDLKKTFKKTLDDMQKSLFKKAKDFLEENTLEVKSKKEFQDAIKNKKMVYCGFCNIKECEETIKDETSATSRCMPFDQKNIAKDCAYCGKKATTMIYFAKSY